MRTRARRSARIALASAAGLAVALLPLSSASASSLDGCSGSATSLDADGQTVDVAIAAGGAISDPQTGAAEATASDPFVVDVDGVVAYDGATDGVITDHTWSLRVQGIEVASGGSANADGEQAATGDYDLGADLPVKITGLVKVDGELVGTGGSCTGSGYVKLDGNPLTSPLTWAGVLFGGVGLVGLFSALPRIRPQIGGPS